jgi:hypothetical protein
MFLLSLMKMTGKKFWNHAAFTNTKKEAIQRINRILQSDEPFSLASKGLYI